MKIMLLILMLAVAIAFAGCRARAKNSFQYFESGKLQAQSYEVDTGFYFFSDGAGKVISPSLTVSGVTF